MITTTLSPAWIGHGWFDFTMANFLLEHGSIFIIFKVFLELRVLEKPTQLHLSRFQFLSVF